MTSLELPPLSLYIHLPWCVRKCPYCDFNSHAVPAHLPQSAYVDALLADLDEELSLVQGRALASIFFGGGTPSLFSPEEIGRLLDGVRARIPGARTPEVTLEANPGTIEHGRFEGYRAAGVTRVSLGAQSFDPAQLALLGRIHGASEIGAAVDELMRAGFDNFNLDLMYALPAQSVEQAVRDVRAAIALQPPHLSHYQLTLEPGTVFYHRPPPLPDADTSWEMQVECQAELARHGYEQYEVSAYARPAARCEHNLNYWRFGDYLGIGAGAHGKVTHIGDRRILRTQRAKQPREYLEAGTRRAVREERVVPERDVPFEFMLNALRLTDGFDLALFRARTGLSGAAIAAPLAEAERKGLLLRHEGDRWRPTELGQRFLNDLQVMFLPDVSARVSS